jgi:Raf kinase inhibitor-like YbhB/YbcL family protein
MKLGVLTFFSLGIFLLSACGSTPTEVAPVNDAPAEPAQAPEPTEMPAEATTPPEPVEESMPFELTSTAFAEGETIPEKYSCKGEDISPPLTWGDPPAGTQSFTLIMDDPDAPVGTWDHWLLFNIPSGKRGLEEDLPITGKNQDPDAIFVGYNSWGRADYGGPCPPSGTHRYFFKLYALDTTISLLPGADKAQIEAEMEEHILAEAELMGTFSK